jgi:hypothetical protein
MVLRPGGRGRVGRRRTFTLLRATPLGVALNISAHKPAPGRQPPARLAQEPHEPAPCPSAMVHRSPRVSSSAAGRTRPHQAAEPDAGAYPSMNSVSTAGTGRGSLVSSRPRDRVSQPVDALRSGRRLLARPWSTHLRESARPISVHRSAGASSSAPSAPVGGLPVRRPGRVAGPPRATGRRESVRRPPPFGLWSAAS